MGRGALPLRPTDICHCHCLILGVHAVRRVSSVQLSIMMESSIALQSLFRRINWVKGDVSFCYAEEIITV
jgi:hypothetical protein